MEDYERWAQVDELTAGLLVEHDAALEEALEASAAAGLPPIAVSANQGKLLALLARLHGSRRVLEVGTLGGYSTIWLARALPAGGRLVTLELNQGYAAVASANVERAGLGGVVDLRVGPAADGMRALIADGEGPFDFIFIDADKQSTPEYFALALELARPGAIVLVDNVVRGGAVADPDTEDAGARGMRRFLELAAAEPRVSGTTIQMVGAKGWDGFTLMVMEGDRSP